MHSLTDQQDRQPTEKTFFNHHEFNLLLLCIVVGLIYSTTLINTVNGNCPFGGITFIFSFNAYYFVDCPLPRSCKDWYDLSIRKNIYYPIYPDGNTQHLVTTVYIRVKKFTYR